MTGVSMRCVLNRRFHLIVLVLSLRMLDNISAATNSDGIKVTLLGTGTPFPNAERFGSAILVQVAGKKLLFDCGRGVVIRLTQAGVNPKEIDGLFLTHLHSDHVVGIPDLLLSGWFLGRDRSLPTWGPPGTRSIADVASGADCLIHAAWGAGWKNPTPPSKRSIASAEDAGRAFAIVKPKLGVVYHYKDEEGLGDAVRKEYNGPFVIAKDLMAIN